MVSFFRVSIDLFRENNDEFEFVGSTVQYFYYLNTPYPCLIFEKGFPSNLKVVAREARNQYSRLQKTLEDHRW
jgi:hypothetical protein